MTERYSILVVDDEVENLDFAVRALRKQYDVAVAKTGDDGLKLVRDRPFAVIVSDQRMPGMDGVQLLSEAARIAPTAERILLTGYASLEAAVDAINLSRVCAFIQKPVQPSALLAAVTAAVEIYRLKQENGNLVRALEQANTQLADKTKLLEMSLDARTAELVQANRRLEELVVRDPLTGVFNHRYFYERCEEEVSRARRYRRQLALVFCDIDHFKLYNDAHGHPAGDEALRQVATLIASGSRRSDILSRTRETDVVARYGGEEFVILLPETDTNGGMVLAERLRAAVEAHPFSGGRLTMSLGVASIPADAVDRATLIGNADKALYAAKHRGRNRVCRYSE